MKKMIAILAFSLTSRLATAADLLLACPSHLHQEIDSLVIMSDKNDRSDAAVMQITMIDGTMMDLLTTKEDVVEGYIELPEFENKERVLLLEENGWFIAVFEKSAILMTPTKCWEPNN